MEEYEKETQETTSTQIKRWFQDNLRIIVSVVIVVAIAGGIYSYSKRTPSPIVSEESISTEEAEDQQAAVEIEETKTDADKQTKKEVSAASSQETDQSFVETAGKGDSATILARRALANYLEKNPDTALTKEHKIYIEDYLRKNVSPKKVIAGSSMEFSKDLIQKSIEQSKKLNDKQLKNLEKYSARATSLT